MPDPPAPEAVTTLPNPLTPLVGRERETGEVVALLRDGVRLVTLTGSGGVGKTRLAIHVAADVADDFPDGVRFVGLAQVAESDLVLHTIAQALGMREAGDQPLRASVAAFLRHRRLLLVLDNFEQVVEAAPMVADMLGASPGLTVLVTSRVRLRVSGEHEYAVPPLGLAGPVATPSVPEVAGSEAARLFVERARAVKSDFALTEANASAVAAICRRLDGLPLAIELAAARVKVLPPAALLGRLEKRLPLLTGGGRDLPARQQTMRNAIAWSHDLLTADEQVQFRRLAVFVGGFTLEAAEAVAATQVDRGGDVFDVVASLVDKSLLREQDGPGGEPRYWMLETVREFGVEQLAVSGEADTVARRHAGWCLAFAERVNRRLLGADPGSWQNRLGAESGNLRAALGWALERGEAETGLRLTHTVGWFWIRIHPGLLGEGRRWQDRLLAIGTNVPPPVRARGLALAGQLAGFAGDHSAAVPLLEEGLALARRIGDVDAVAEALWYLGQLAVAVDDTVRAVPLLEEALSLFLDVGREIEAAWSLTSLGTAARKEGDLGRARALHWEALAKFRGLGCATGSAWVETALGEVATDAGDAAGAAGHLRDGLRLHQDHLEPKGAEFCLLGLAKLAGAGGRHAAAARLLGAAMALREAGGSSLPPDHRESHDRCVAAAKAALGEAPFAVAWAAGRTLPPEQILAQADQLADDLNAAPLPNRPLSAAMQVGLTARELDVLRLLAEGRSDREIAGALFLSYRTVTSYVTSILGKLGVDSRTAAATYAVRHGLA